MKKLAALLLVLSCLFCLFTACGPSQDAEDPSKEDQDVVPDKTVTVSPLPVTLDVAQLDNCTAAVSLNDGDVYADSTGAVQMKVTVYTYDLYDMVDIANLEEGDVIVIRQEKVKVTNLDRDDSGDVRINGGLDVGGYELRTDESGVYFEISYSDIKSYYAIGETTLPVSADFTYTDSSNPDEDPVVYSSNDFLTEGTGIVYHFVPDNTSIVIEGGEIVSMSRVYTP